MICHVSPSYSNFCSVDEEAYYIGEHDLRGRDAFERVGIDAVLKHDFCSVDEEASYIGERGVLQ